jgi:hypothetical protein
MVGETSVGILGANKEIQQRLPRSPLLMLSMYVCLLVIGNEAKVVLGSIAQKPSHSTSPKHTPHTGPVEGTTTSQQASKNSEDGQ